MRSIFRILIPALLLLIPLFSVAQTGSESIKGTYQAVLLHEQNRYFQYASITLNTVNTGDGNLKISAGVRLLFGDQNSNEFLTYEYPDCALNILTRQISMKNEATGVSFIGFLKNGTIQGDWYSPSIGKVGSFSAQKNGTPAVPTAFELVKSVTGHYIGKVKNTNPASNLPENVTISLITTQDPSSSANNIAVSGNLRLYFGDTGSSEFVETRFSQTEFNFYNRYLTAKTANYGLTLKGSISLNGAFKGDVFADGLGHVGTIEVVAR